MEHEHEDETGSPPHNPGEPQFGDGHGGEHNPGEFEFGESDDAEGSGGEHGAADDVADRAEGHS